MALSKTITTEFGVDATHWVLDSLTARRGRMFQVRIIGYVSKEAKEAGSTPVTDMWFELDPELLESVSIPDNIVKALYNQIKNQPEMADAKDA